MVGVEMMAGVVDMGAIYEELWLSGDRTTATARGLEKELVALYANVLVYLVKARRYYEKNMAGRFSSILDLICFADEGSEDCGGGGAGG